MYMGTDKLEKKIVINEEGFLAKDIHVIPSIHISPFKGALWEVVPHLHFT